MSPEPDMSVTGGDFGECPALAVIGSMATANATTAASMVRPALIALLSAPNITAVGQSVNNIFACRPEPIPITGVILERYRRQVHKLDFGPP